MDPCVLLMSPSSSTDVSLFFIRLFLSLGVLLFEMFHAPFDTMMERARTIGDLRTKSQLPPGFLSSTPPAVHKVSRLTYT